MNRISDEEDGKDHLMSKVQSDDTYYRSIIENNSFYVIKTDLQGNYSYMNPFFCQQFNLDLGQWLGRPSIDLIISEDHQACMETVQECFKEPGSSHWVILRKPHFRGIISTQWEFKTVQDESGNPIEVLCIGHDITSLIIREKELQSLVEITANQNKKLLNFTYIISHNIRSHVANIIGIIELNETGNQEDKDLSWNIIKKSIHGLDATIHDLNDIINIQTNINLPIKTVFLKYEVDRIIENIKVLFDKAGTQLTYHFDDSIHIKTNPAYFESIILNLLTNALKYKSDDRGLKLDLSFIQQPNYSVLVFKDNGLGIDLAYNRDKVFGMYNTFHDKPDAKGMGLFIIKNQIEALGGHIEVESNLNESTTFRIFFPVRD